MDVSKSDKPSDLSLFQKLFQPVQENLKENFFVVVNRRYFFDRVKEFNELTFFLDDPDWEEVRKIIDGEISLDTIDHKLSRALACLISSGIGDALGTHTEFMHVEYDREPNIIEGFEKLQIAKKYYRCNLGEFSDDTSMALCLADNILVNEFKFDGVDLMIKFINWWVSSYNNCLNPRRDSFGLGGNVGSAIDAFTTKAATTPDLQNNLDSLPHACNYRDKYANGNGTLMRLAPVPVAFSSDERLLPYALDFAGKQSKVTHTGEEAAEACKLLTHLIIKLVNRKDLSLGIKESIEQALKDFETPNYSVTCIKNSIMEDEDSFKKRLEECEIDHRFSKDPSDRNWNWKDPNFRYAPTREKMMPGYIGSYCLDAISMALHIAYHSTSLKGAILKAVNMGGDCDTVGAITGQLVGAFYGLDGEILKLYKGMRKFDKGKLAYVAYKLFNSPKDSIK